MPSPLPDQSNDVNDSSEPLPVNVPREIGGYRIQRIIGSGGMATVYAAMQKQPRRIVALKVMKAGISLARGDVAYRRFKREIEILGKLRHPYIAQIYDAGVHDDGSSAVPYFVMEYVPGAKSITEYIAVKQLDVRERLKLFVKVCAAIEHGHRCKVIHRDLKPGNILIDENGDPKIIDFGVAQATELDMTAQTMNTDAGRLVGTLQYMSPEQLDTSQHDLDARCDVYAMGVLLYKLMTGKPPHDLEGLPVYEAVRIIKEETPRKPSDVKPEVFRGAIRGDDLETIMLKAMEPDRTRRYRNAGSLGRDIVRFLADKPINARRANVFYRTGLFVRRNRAAVIAGSIAAGVMLIALEIVVSERLNRAGDERDRTSQSTVAITQLPPVTLQAPTAITAPAEPFTLRGHTGTISRLVFSPDGKTLVSTSYDHHLARWNLHTRSSHRGIINGGAVEHLMYSANGLYLVFANTSAFTNTSVYVTRETNTIRSDATTGRAPTIIAYSVSAIACNSDATRIAVASDNLTLRIIEINGGEARDVHTLRSASGAFTTVAFDRSGEWIAAGSQRGDVYVWNAHTGEQLARFTQLKAEVGCIGFVDKENDAGESLPLLVAVDFNGSACRWEISGTESVPHSFSVAADQIADASFDPTGQWLAVATGTKATVWNVSAEMPTSIGEVDGNEVIHAIAVDADGKRCAIGYGNGDIVIAPVLVRNEQ